MRSAKGDKVMALDNPAYSASSEFLPAEPDQEALDGKELNLSQLPSESSEPKTRQVPSFNLFDAMASLKMKYHWLVNGLIVLSLAALTCILEFDIIPFKTIGFQCKDINLVHKYRGDTIKFQYLLAVTFTLPLLVIIVVDSINISSNQTYLPVKRGRNLRQAWICYGQYMFGLLTLLLLVQFGKSLIGGPRPHFFDTCRPDKAINCTTEYYFDYKCTNKNLSAWNLRDSSRSFPSGHAALGIYMAVFLSAFLQCRIPLNKYLVVPWLQCILMTWAVFCCLSRVTDRRHHWWDVLAGAVFGAIWAMFTVKTQCKNFRWHFHMFRGPDKNLNDTGNLNHAWTKKLLSPVNNGPMPPPSSDDRELREVK